MPSIVPDILAANRRYAETFTLRDLSKFPARQVVVLTCMDARLDPVQALGLNSGDAHILRNAGGRATEDAIRSIAISQQFLNTREIVVIHHTDCGTQAVTDDQVRAALREHLGIDASEVQFLTNADLRDGLRSDVERLRASPLLEPDTRVSGLVYDVASGGLSLVEEPLP